MKKVNVNGMGDKKEEKLSISPLTRHFVNAITFFNIVHQVSILFPPLFVQR